VYTVRVSELSLSSVTSTESVSPDGRNTGSARSLYGPSDGAELLPSDRLAARSLPERARRKRLVKGRTINTRDLSQMDGHRESSSLSSGVSPRPKVRSECETGPRPCPYVSCRYHLYLEVSPTTGSLKLNFPDLEVWELADSCALDVAERGAQTTEALGELLNLTPERARQLELSALDGVLSSLGRDAR
jgi:hypothetical protein